MFEVGRVHRVATRKVPIVSLFLSEYLVQDLYSSLADVQENELAADAVF